MNENPHVPVTSIHRIEADGVKVFYREAGPADAPVVLLLHGFPTSSFQYRDLISRLADKSMSLLPIFPALDSRKFRRSVITDTRSMRWRKRSLHSPTRCTSNAMHSMSSTTARPRDFDWQWLVRRV
jgi:pimeloyl-ACP methyl ester carboxylesterase